MRWLFLAVLLFIGCGGGSGGSKPLIDDELRKSVDEKVNSVFGEDNTSLKITGGMKYFVGNWYGNEHYFKIWLQLRRDGSYLYKSSFGIGKYHNYYRISTYKGKWKLNKNHQVVLDLNDTYLVLDNRFPFLYSFAGVNLTPGEDVEIDADVKPSSSHLQKASYTPYAKKIMKRKVSDFNVDYFTIVAAKANSPAFWGDLTPKGYNYGHKLGYGSEDWNYALKRMKEDYKNYAFVISDEAWQNIVGSRGNYVKDIQHPDKIYRWLEYFKCQMQLLSKVKGPVLYIIAGDAPAYWAGNIREKFDNDPKNVPAKLLESNFPEVLERNPDNSFGGIFQMMDFLRMKYAPNVKLGYTLKTWGIAASKDLFSSKDWATSEEMQVMADYLNNYGVQFDILAFNLNPRSPSHSVEEYKSAVSYFGEIAKHMKTRDGFVPKTWIWKVSLWNREHTTFYFQNIDFLVDHNIIGMTLGHGNDLVKLKGFRDDVQNHIYIKSWLHEYFLGEENSSIPVHATEGIVYWR
jgi:hypothetical protein